MNHPEIANLNLSFVAQMISLLSYRVTRLEEGQATKGILARRYLSCCMVCDWRSPERFSGTEAWQEGLQHWQENHRGDSLTVVVPAE
jgi:hypothetical protein